MGKKDTTPLKFQKSLALENIPLSNSPASPPPSSPNLRGGGRVHTLMPKVYHYNTIYFLTYTHPGYIKCLQAYKNNRIR